MNLSEKEKADMLYSNQQPEEIMSETVAEQPNSQPPKQDDAVLTLLQQMMGKIDSLEQKVRGIEQGGSHSVAALSNTIEQQKKQLNVPKPIYVAVPNELAYNPNQFNRRKIVNADSYYEPKDVVGMYSASEHKSVRFDQEDNYLLNGFSISVPSQNGGYDTMVVNDQFISIDSIKALFIDNSFITQWGSIQFTGLPAISHNGVVVAKYISGKWI